MLLNPMALLLLGIIILAFHYWLKWNLKYLNSLQGSKIFLEQIEFKIQNNEKLTLREKANIFYKKIFDMLIYISWKIGVVLIILAAVLKIISKIKG